MLYAKDAAKLLHSMTPEERVMAMKKKIGKATQAALEKGIRETIATLKTKVDLVLGAEICKEKDADIEDLLVGLGYDDVKVTSNFPGRGESFRGTTSISFSIPLI